MSDPPCQMLLTDGGRQRERGVGGVQGAEVTGLREGLRMLGLRRKEDEGWYPKVWFGQMGGRRCQATHRKPEGGAVGYASGRGQFWTGWVEVALEWH